jgi:myo-inositol-1-phosphate synthase
MSERRVGLWMIGACGGVGTTVALGLAALKRGLIDTTSMVTALPLFEGIDLDQPGDFVLGGHEVRRTSYRQAVTELQQRSNVFDAAVVNPCLGDLDEWSANVRPGTVLNTGATINRIADLPEAHHVATPRAAFERIKEDLLSFREKNRLDQLMVLNVASTEPPFELSDVHQSLDQLVPALKKSEKVLPASALYGGAALELGLPYINFTPSLGASFPALEELAQKRKAVYGGKDAKTGETLMKTVLAPMFALRNWKILSWVGHNIFGNRDGLVLDDPVNKASKIKTKDQVISSIVGYKPQTHVSIEYIESLDDWKTAWDHIHFKGFLNTKMMLQFTWQGCDSLLAAPLAIDVCRLALLAQRHGEVGVLKHLACFWKNPMGTTEHDFFKQFAMLEEYVAKVRASATPPAPFPLRLQGQTDEHECTIHHHAHEHPKVEMPSGEQESNRLGAALAKPANTPGT